MSHPVSHESLVLFITLTFIFIHIQHGVLEIIHLFYMTRMNTHYGKNKTKKQFRFLVIAVAAGIDKVALVHLGQK